MHLYMPGFKNKRPRLSQDFNAKYERFKNAIQRYKDSKILIFVRQMSKDMIIFKMQRDRKRHEFKEELYVTKK